MSYLITGCLYEPSKSDSPTRLIKFTMCTMFEQSVYVILCFITGTGQTKSYDKRKFFLTS